MKVSLTVIAPKGGYEAAFNQDSDRVRKTVTAAFRKAGEKIKKDGRAAIQAGGLSSRWQNAFRVNVYPKSGDSGSPAIFAYHKIPYAGQFEDPKAVQGKPLIWLPITQNLPGGQRWTPAKYTRQIGPLKSGRGGGKPLLFGQISVNRKSLPVKLARKGGFRGKAVARVWLPVFVGVRSVSDPKLFDTGAVVRRVGDDLSNIYSDLWNGNKDG